MKNLKIDKKNHVYFVGIGGISMSGLAKILLHDGIMVKGSDIGEGKEIEYLKDLGVIIYPNHDKNNISDTTQLVVYTGAIKGDNPELLEAKRRGIRIMERSEFLGVIASKYDKVISISGTHGKTTTTAMIGEIFETANLNPTIHLGGESIGLKGNTIIGDKKYFIVEACEYRESFKYLHSFIGVVTNIDLDHLDYYKDYSSIHLAFEKFATNSQNLICLDDCHLFHDNCQLVLKDWVAKNIESVGGGYNFNVHYKGSFFASFRLNMIGLHNITNSLFAIAVAHFCGINKNTIVSGLSSFLGVERRFERIARLDNCSVIIDYAHHPTELINSIEGLSAVYKRILYVFQPHTYTRTLKLFDDFVEVLGSLSDIVIFKTYPAREVEIKGGTAKDLFDALCVPNKQYFDDNLSLIEYLETQKNVFDCILILGAGDLATILKNHYSTH